MTCSALTFFAHLVDVPSGRAAPATNQGRMPVAYPMRSPEPAQTGGEHPLQGAGGQAELAMIRNMRGMISATGEMSDRVQAGRMRKFASRTPDFGAVSVLEEVVD